MTTYTLMITTPQYQTSISGDYQMVDAAMWDMIFGWEARGYAYDNRQGAYVDFLWGYWVTFQLISDHLTNVRTSFPLCHIMPTQ